MDLVTVTYLQDIDDMARQSESIAKFVDPCTHWVIVNDANIDQIKEKLQPYYKTHSLNLINFSNEFLESVNCEYRKQQILKLYMSKLLKEKYLVLDSKNFFIKKINVNEFSNQIGSSILESVEKNHLFYNTIEAYKKILEYEKTDNLHFAIQTPFVIDPEILYSLDNFDILLSKFASVGPYMSEFFFYSLLYEKRFQTLVKKEIEKSSKSKHFTAFETNIPIKEIIQMTSLPTLKVLALHRNYKMSMKNNDIKIFNDFLKSIGLNNLMKEKDV